MMQRCCSSQMGECTCGSFHTQSDSYTMLFPMPNGYYESDHMYPCAYDSSSSSSSSSVDCTLSLGTPSTRLCEDDDKRLRHDSHSSSSSFSWDIFHTKNTHKTTRRAANNTSDPLLARRCANCDTTSTPLWRNGPRGPKSLCNACGIRYKKEERRAIAANGSTTMEQQFYGTNNWVETAANEFRFIEESDQRDSDTSGIPFHSWRLNSASLVHHFTA